MLVTPIFYSSNKISPVYFNNNAGWRSLKQDRQFMKDDGGILEA